MHHLTGGDRIDGAKEALTELRSFSIQPDGDRAVICQSHRHIRSELARLDGNIQATQGCCEMFVQIARHIGLRGIGKARPGAARGIGGQGELADNQGAAPGLRKAEVHFACVIFEQA